MIKLVFILLISEVATKLLLLAGFILSMILMGTNHRKKKKRIVFFGDSITEQGARAGGYIRILEKFLKEERLEDDCQLVGAGVSGNKVTDLIKRLNKDVLSDGADVVVIFIGINDVWHKLNAKGTDKDTFRVTYQEIINRLVAAGIKVVLCTPTVIGEQKALVNFQDTDMEEYSAIIRELVELNELPLVDLRKAFTDFLDQNNVENHSSGILTNDSVHLNKQGNGLVAAEMWKVLQHII